MNRAQHSFENLSLLQAAVDGDEEAAQKALQFGADVNALHHDGRTTIACAVTGESWETNDASFMSQSRLKLLQTLVSHKNVSLFSLNAPQDAMKGVTPLGMTAWLNAPEAVKILLEASAGSVSVDGMDAHGATALMYAARDGNLGVIRVLLEYGARPDFRDVHHRTSIQFALGHSPALWACEDALRQVRWQESESRNRRNLTPLEHSHAEHLAAPLTLSQIIPTSPITPNNCNQTTHLVQAILSSDFHVVYSTLYPPPASQTFLPVVPTLVNLPDSQGWSPIHYCVATSRPSIVVLDALYRSGADVSLFTVSEHYTPLHCLALTARQLSNSMDSDSTSLLYNFTVHLIQDLRAPLSARDKQEETCIHIAAEHGQCIDVLNALLACDTTGVREMRNSRGFTAFEVAQPQFRYVFGVQDELVRPVSVASVRTIRPMNSLSSLSEWTPVAGPSQPRPDTPDTLTSDFDVSASSYQLIENLRLTSPQLYHDTNQGSLDRLNDLVITCAHISRDIVAYFRSRTDEALKELQSARATFNTVDERLDIVAHAVREKLDILKIGGLGHQYTKRRNRDSEDSQKTAVSTDEGIEGTTFGSKDLPHSSRRDVAVSTDPSLSEHFDSEKSPPGIRSMPWPEWLDPFVLSADSSTYKAHLANLVEIQQELAPRSRFSMDEEDRPTDAKLQGLVKKKRKEEARAKELADVKKAWWLNKEKQAVSKSGTAKLKAWLRRKLTTDRPLKFEISLEIDEQGCAVGREVKFVSAQELPSGSMPRPTDFVETLDRKVLVSSNATLATVGRDIGGIEECLNAANQFINTAYHSITRVDRLTQQALTARKSSIDHLHLAMVLDSYHEGLDNDLFTYSPSPSPSDPPLSPSSSPNSAASLASALSSATSSNISLASTLNEGDDEDTRALQRLLLRKIEPRINGALQEIEKANVWLRIVKEVVRGVTKRACL